MVQTHGSKADRSPITDDMVEAMADEATRGDELKN